MSQVICLCKGARNSDSGNVSKEGQGTNAVAGMNCARKQGLYAFHAQTPAKFPHHTPNNQKPLLGLWPGQCFTNYPEDKNHLRFLFKVFSLVPEDSSSPYHTVVLFYWSLGDFA